MPEITARFSTALADRYEIQHKLGAGGIAMNIEYPTRNIETEVSPATSIFLVQYSIFDIQLAHPVLAVRD